MFETLYDYINYGYLKNINQDILQEAKYYGLKDLIKNWNPNRTMIVEVKKEEIKAEQVKNVNPKKSGALMKLVRAILKIFGL